MSECKYQRQHHAYPHPHSGRRRGPRLRLLVPLEAAHPHRLAPPRGARSSPIPSYSPLPRSLVIPRSAGSFSPAPARPEVWRSVCGSAAPPRSPDRARARARPSPRGRARAGPGPGGHGPVARHGGVEAVQGAGRLLGQGRLLRRGGPAPHQVGDVSPAAIACAPPPPPPRCLSWQRGSGVGVIV